MKLGMMTSAALALGISMAATEFAKAHELCRDQNDSYSARRDYREEDRRVYDRPVIREDVRPAYDRPVVRDEICRDIDRPVIVPRTLVQDVALCDVPRCVADRVNEYRHGRGIQSGQKICENGHDFYQFRICDARHGDFTLQIEPSGHLFARLDR